jgi:ATP/maltotriose-dependent transcriptional regulator MalT
MVLQGRKNSPPPLPSPILSREALLQKLADALIPTADQASTACKLVLLRAPAGYGKTTLLVDFARRHPVPIGWYFLEHTDAQLQVFLETLTGVFCQTFPELTRILSIAFLRDLVVALQSNNDLQREQALDNYTAALEQYISQPFILCLCDYQKVNEDESIQVVLNHLLQKMPARLTLVIESRSVPSLELSPLLARRQLLGLGSHVLGFSPQEVQAYVHLQHGLSLPEADAERLVKTFDGWITGLLLATPLGDPFAEPTLADNAWSSPTRFAEQLTLLAYIKHEVFAQEEQAFAFLQATTVLAYLNAPRCNYLLQTEQADTWLTHIERQGLFLTRAPIQGATPTYVLQPALRQLLLEDMQYKQPEQFALLHQRAAEFFRADGDNERALTHAIAAQVYPLAIDIIVQAASSNPADSSQYTTLVRWCEMLPVAIHEQHPHLLLIRAKLYITQRELLQAAPLLEQAYQLVTHPASALDEDSSPILLAEILIARSTIPFQAGQYTHVPKGSRISFS